MLVQARDQSKLGAALRNKTLPSAHPDLFDLLAAGNKTRGDRTNRDYVGDAVIFAQEISKEMRSALFDPQTSGGMLISVASEKRDALLSELHKRGVEVAEIGRVLDYNGRSIEVF